MSDREVKTRQAAEEFADKLGYLPASSARDDFYEGWSAALDSVTSVSRGEARLKLNLTSLSYVVADGDRIANLDQVIDLIRTQLRDVDVTID